MDRKVKVEVTCPDGTRVSVETWLSGWLAFLAAAEVGLEGAVEAHALEQADWDEAVHVLGSLAVDGRSN